MVCGRKDVTDQCKNSMATAMSSSYTEELKAEDRAAYFKKLQIKTGEVLPDPYTLKDWSCDISNLPDITWRDVTEYLIDTPSPFTKEAMKAYKSLEAYDYFVGGHVQDCYFHGISKDSEYCFIQSEVGNK